mmetsp:Transcript_33935/g.101251  ORF Transcript_33935/g.101251 Transcript_33935/m.101251 type:complete len:389 (-) Transcript_33935:1500-2666(-)
MAATKAGSSLVSLPLPKQHNCPVETTSQSMSPHSEPTSSPDHFHACRTSIPAPGQTQCPSSGTAASFPVRDLEKGGSEFPSEMATLSTKSTHSLSALAALITSRVDDADGEKGAALLVPSLPSPPPPPILCSSPTARCGCHHFRAPTAALAGSTDDTPGPPASSFTSPSDPLSTSLADQTRSPLDSPTAAAAPQSPSADNDRIGQSNDPRQRRRGLGSEYRSVGLGGGGGGGEGGPRMASLLVETIGVVGEADEAWRAGERAAEEAAEARLRFGEGGAPTPVDSPCVFATSTRDTSPAPDDDDGNCWGGGAPSADGETCVPISPVQPSVCSPVETVSSVAVPELLCAFAASGDEEADWLRAFSFCFAAEDPALRGVGAFERSSTSLMS